MFFQRGCFFNEIKNIPMQVLLPSINRCKKVLHIGFKKKFYSYQQVEFSICQMECHYHLMPHHRISYGHYFLGRRKSLPNCPKIISILLSSSDIWKFLFNITEFYRHNKFQNHQNFAEHNTEVLQQSWDIGCFMS